MPETVIIPLTSLEALKDWMKQEYRDLGRRENLSKATRQSYHNKICELIRVGDQIGLDLTESKKLEED